MNQPSPGGMGAFLRMQLILLLLLIGLAGTTVGLAAGLRQAGGEPVWPLILGMAGLLAAGLVWLHKGIVRPWQQILDRSQRELLAARTNEEPAPVQPADPTDHERLPATLTAAAIGTWEEDFVTGRTAWSENVPGLLGITGPLVTPTWESFLDAVVPEDREALAQVRQAARNDSAQHDGFQVEFRACSSDGEVRWLEVKGRVFRDPQGKPVDLMAILFDCTQRCRADLALRTACAAHEDINSARSRFLASVSHELRTPLAGVIGLSELLQETPVNEEQRDYLQTLSRTAEGLLALLNDLLDLSKIEAGKLVMDNVPFNLQEVVADALSVFSQPAQTKGLRLSSAIDPVVPVRLIGDPHRLRQVLLNLIGNAIKFTHQGEVVVGVFTAEGAENAEEDRGRKEDARPSSPLSLSSSASSAPSAVSSCLLRFSVRDTGIGIAPDKLARIFQPFEQAETSTTRTYGGTGLGLTISARLVEMMGGKLSVQSDVGHGSTFTFTCPLQLDETRRGVAIRKQQASAVAPRSLHILLVEDNPVNQQVLTLLLEKAGHRVRLAGNGKEALLVLEQEKFDLVLMDLQMPEMDGLRATRLLRAREKSLALQDIAGADARGRVPVVAVTANALQGERQRCLAAGMDDYLSKPIRGAELFAAIARLVGRDAVPPGTVAEELPASTPLWLQTLESMHLARQDINRLVRTFLDTVPDRLVTLHRALNDSNATLLQSTAHTLKGSLAIFSPQAASIARQVEDLARQRQLPQAVAPLRELVQEVGALLSAMTGFLQSAS